MFFALLAVVAMVACEDNLEGNKGVDTKYDFAFDASGVCYSQSAKEVSQSEFEEKVVGYCWSCGDWYEIYSDGSVSSEDYGASKTGLSTTRIHYFKDNNEVKNYSTSTAYPPGMDSGYGIYKYTFDSSKIYFGDDRNARYQILEVSEEEMAVIMQYKYYQGYDSQIKTKYILTTFVKLTEEQHKKVEEVHWRNWAEVE